MSGYQPGVGDFTVPSRNGITDYLNNTSGLAKEVGQGIASLTLTKIIEAGLASSAAKGMGEVARQAGQAGGSIAASAGVKAGLIGALVQPAVWIIGGQTPQPGDVELWIGSSIIGTLGGIAGTGATFAVAVMKAAAEDQEDGEIGAAAAWEPKTYRPFIRSVRSFGSAAREIVATQVAAQGGVAWRVGKHNWCYLTDATGRLVCDYRPAFSYEVIHPELPLRIAETTSGKYRFIWRRGPGTHVG